MFIPQFLSVHFKYEEVNDKEILSLHKMKKATLKFAKKHPHLSLS